MERSNQRVVVLLGAPGAGKGTQAARLAAARGLPHVSTGDLFRENLGQGTELGQKAKSYMESGNLVPDELVLEMLFDRVSRPDCASGYVLDGFPRTLPQAEALEAKLPSDTTELIAPNLEVDDEVVVRRISGRLVCKDCGNIHHQDFAPPTKEGVCDACGGELFQRKDDRADVVQERLRVYHEETEPLVAFYDERGVLRRVDGSRDPDAVFSDLLEIVSKGEAA